jgi:hypothetical protein
MAPKRARNDRIARPGQGLGAMRADPADAAPEAQ